MKEQLDPTVYTVLTAKSKIPGVSLVEFAAFTPKWLNTQNTFRPPVCFFSFVWWLVWKPANEPVVLSQKHGYGNWWVNIWKVWWIRKRDGPRRTVLREQLYAAWRYALHIILAYLPPMWKLTFALTESYEAFKRATTATLEPSLQGVGNLGPLSSSFHSRSFRIQMSSYPASIQYFNIFSSRLHVASKLTSGHYEIRIWTPCWYQRFVITLPPIPAPHILHTLNKSSHLIPSAQRPNLWNNVQGHFLDHLDEVNAILKSAGRPKLGEGAPMA